MKIIILFLALCYCAFGQASSPGSNGDILLTVKGSPSTQKAVTPVANSVLSWNGTDPLFTAYTALPVSTATQQALNGKQDAITAGTSLEYIRADFSKATLNTSAVDGITSYWQGILDEGNQLSAHTALGLVVGSTIQEYNASLTTLVNAPTSANLAAFINNEVGSGNVIFGNQAVSTGSSPTFAVVASTGNINAGVDLTAAGSVLATSSVRAGLAGSFLFNTGARLKSDGTATGVYVRNNADNAYGNLTIANLNLFASASAVPSVNGQLTIEATNNTTLTFRFKGSDGTVRSGTITLAP